MVTPSNNGNELWCVMCFLRKNPPAYKWTWSSQVYSQRPPIFSISHLGPVTLLSSLESLSCLHFIFLLMKWTWNIPQIIVLSNKKHAIILLHHCFGSVRVKTRTASLTHSLTKYGLPGVSGYWSRHRSYTCHGAHILVGVRHATATGTPLYTVW